MKTIINKKSFRTVAALCIAVSLTTSCKKDFEDINTDPNNPEDVPNEFYLTGAQRGLMDNTIDIWFGGQVGNQLAQYWSSNQYTSESRYLFRTQITNDYFNESYSGGNNDELIIVGGLLELNRIIDNCKTKPGLSSASGDPDNQIAIATTLRVWKIQNMTDTWGAIPYSDALAPELTRAPSYDSQQAIYNGLLSEINTAISLIDENAIAPIKGDVIYDGDMALWRKFANSVKMRLAIRLADVDGPKASAAFSEAISGGAFTSNADNALFTYGVSAVNSNPVYYNYEVDGRNDYAASNTFMALLDSGVGHPLQDPRLPCFFAPAEGDGSWTPEVYGLSEANGASTTNSAVSQRSPLILSATLPGIFMDYAQVEFMLAEAAERSWPGVSGTAEDHYKAGITASIEFWTSLNGTPATTAEINAYIAQDSVDYTLQKNVAQTADKWKFPVGKQKWIALHNQGIQGWAEWRRLDFGILQLPADGILDGTVIPLRLKYAEDEITLNGGNYSAAVAMQGPDLQETRLWWDTN